MDSKQNYFPLYHHVLVSNILSRKGELVSIVGKITSINTMEEYFIL